MKRHRPERKGVILAPAPIETLPITSIARLEELRDQTEAEEWISRASHRSVLFGIKLCIATLKRENINEIK